MSGRVMPSRTVFVSGNFNVLHPGHLRLLRFARECGERLIVAVNSDRIAGNAAHVPELLRLEGVQSNSWVDEAFVTDTAVTADVLVETESQKQILIGRGGSMVREIGTRARPEIEQILGRHVYLELHVKVKPRWRRDDSMLERLGI